MLQEKLVLSVVVSIICLLIANMCKCLCPYLQCSCLPIPAMFMSAVPVMQSMHNVFNQNCNNLPFISNPYYSAFSMPWNMPGMNNMFISLFKMMPSQMYASKLNINVFAQKSSPKPSMLKKNLVCG